MNSSSKTSSRTVYTVFLTGSPSTKQMTLPSDLTTLLLHLRLLLQNQPAKNPQIDSDLSQYIEAIINQIKSLTNRNEPTEVFDTIQSTLKVYVDDFLTIEKCLSIVSNDSFQEIFQTLVNVDATIDFEDLFNLQPLYARTVCYRSFDLLSLKILTDFLTNQCAKELVDHLAQIAFFLIIRIQSTIEFVTFKKNDFANQVPLIRLLLEFIHKNVKNSDQPPMSNILDGMMNFFWALSDDTILVPNLLDAFCHQYFLAWISMVNLPLNMYRASISTLHNLARHDRGARSLSEANGIKILKEFKSRFLDQNKNRTESLYVEFRLLYCMTISLLTEPKESREDLNELRPILDQLMQLAISAGESANNKFGGFHVSEPVVVLTKLCVHDEILKYVLNQSSIRGPDGILPLQFFCEVLVKFRGALASDNDIDQLTLVALLNILWSVSFHDEYGSKLRANTKFLMTVKSLAIDDGENLVEQYVPRHMSSVPKAASGILWNLDEDNPGRAARTTTNEVEKKADESSAKPSTNSDDRLRVMVSYCHADSTFCRQLVEALEKNERLQIWVDFLFCHSEDFWEEIADAIEKANVILFLMSKDYQDSKSCRQEVMYAKDTLKKRFIPIYIQKEFVATSWLGVRIVGPQYVRFGKRSFDDTMKDLTKLVLEDKTTNPPPEKKPVEPTKPKPVEPIDSTVPTLIKPVQQWTSEDVSQWFVVNRLQEDLCNLYQFNNGSELLLYAQCFQTDWQSEYNDVRDRFQKKFNHTLYRDEFVRFVDALKRLETPTKVKSRTCSLS